MTKLPVVDAKTMKKVLSRLGFSAVRQKGSHVFYRHPDGRTTTVPDHANRDLARPLIRAILRDIDLTRRILRICCTAVDCGDSSTPHAIFRVEPTLSILQRNSSADLKVLHCVLDRFQGHS